MAANHIALPCLFLALLVIGVKSREDFDESSSDICNQERKPGRCMAIFPRWYYNSAWKNCTKFIYGGCQGNKNNFKTKDECERTCLRKGGNKLKTSAEEPVDEEYDEEPCREALEGSIPLKINCFKARLFYRGLCRPSQGTPVQQSPFDVKHILACKRAGYSLPLKCSLHIHHSKWTCVDKSGKKIKLDFASTCGFNLCHKHH